MKRSWSPLQTYAPLAVVVVLLLYFGNRLSRTVQPNYEHVIFVWDQEGYYKYLQSAFIWQQFDSVQAKFPQNFPKHPQTGRAVDKYTCGVALLQLPFFGIAQQTVPQGERHLQGVGNHHALWMKRGALCYAALGLWLVGLMLMHHWQISPRVAALSVAVLALGTNLSWYATGEPLMSHIYTFALVALWLYLTPGTLARAHPLRWVGYAAVLGLIVLIRPINGLVVLYPLLWAWPMRWPFRSVAQAALVLALCLLAMGLVWLPQLLYWHHTTGHWVYYSYGEEGFTNLWQPELLNVLAAPMNGWLTYAPAMVLALLGIPLLLRQHPRQGMGIVLPFALVFYLCASWWMWFFGGSLGYRPFIDYLPLLAVPMALLLQRVFSAPRQWALKVGVSLFVVMACVVSVGFMVRYNGNWSYPEWDWATYTDMLTRVLLFR